MTKYTQEDIIKTLKAVHFKCFTDKTLNIVGVRENMILNNQFQDKLYVWSSNIPFTEFTITTKPGKFWWEHFTRKQGVAILVENQYFNAYKIGKHKSYTALVQSKDVIVYRDANKDTNVDTGKTEKGLFGINIHKASSKWMSPFVDKWSAGCQVFANPKEFETFIELCKNSEQTEFTYSLINDKIINKALLK